MQFSGGKSVKSELFSLFVRVKMQSVLRAVDPYVDTSYHLNDVPFKQQEKHWATTTDQLFVGL